MDASDVRYMCASYGDWFANQKYKGLNLGFSKENILYKIFHGTFNLDKHKTLNQLTVDETPERFKELELVLDRMKNSNPKLHQIFIMHWCVYFIGKKKANIKMKAKALKVSESKYYTRLNSAMDIVNFFFVDDRIQINNLERELIEI